ncbi:MAG: TPM domain-containing protein [Oscillospiraceae bacterium]|nr:TPM domain-containing protein [Oscillospiraceae bacterium]
MMKKIFSLLACLTVAVTMASPLYAHAETDVYDDYYYEDDFLSEYDDWLDDTADDDTLGETGELKRVVDKANLLTVNEEDDLKESIDKLIDEYQFDCVILTVDSFGGNYMDISDYAYNYYLNNGYGLDYKNSDFSASVQDEYGRDGIIFVVSMNTREWWFLQFGDGKKVISDSYGLEWLEYKVIDELSDGDYYECFDKFVTSVHDFVREASEDKPYGTLHPKIDVEAYWEKINDKIIIIIAITVVALLIIASLLKKTMKTVMRQPDANSYVKRGSFKLYFMNDTFLRTSTTRTRVKSSGGGRGGGSRGGSRGGRGGRF